MATNYTEHYGLSLWEANDKFYHQEFNENHQKIDDALHGHAAALAAKADAAQTATCIQSLETRKATVVTGSYTGSGLYGAAHPNRLDFAGLLDGPPKLVIVRPVVGVNLGLIFLHGMKSAMFTLAGVNDVNNNCTIAWTDTGLSWYSGSVYSQYSSADSVYLYFAIG